MFDTSHRPPSLSIPAEEPLQTQFTIKLDCDQALTIRMLAARAGCAPQKVVEHLATGINPFRAAVGLTAGGWTATCPATGQHIPADMTEARDAWFDDLLYLIDLLKGEALQDYIRTHTKSDDNKET